MHIVVMLEERLDNPGQPSSVVALAVNPKPSQADAARLGGLWGFGFRDLGSWGSLGRLGSLGIFGHLGI